MKKIILILILAIGFVSESKAQENSEIYYYVQTEPKYSFVIAMLVQFQNYGKRIVSKGLWICEGEDVDKKIQENNWYPYKYSSKYSNDKYDTYYYTNGTGTYYETHYLSFSKDKQTIIKWQGSISTRSYYKRVTISELKEMCAVKMPDFLE